MHLHIAVPDSSYDVIIILVHLLRLLEGFDSVLRFLYGDQGFPEEFEVLEFWVIGGEVSVLLSVEATILKVSKEDVGQDYL